MQQCALCARGPRYSIYRAVAAEHVMTELQPPAVLRSLKLATGIRGIPGIEGLGAAFVAELAAHYRVPHVRLVVRTRVMCQAGRARAAGARRRGEIAAWLCERAPLWVVVHVCALLRDTDA